MVDAVTKDLNYYMEHPEEMPTDPAEIEKIADATPIEGQQTDDEAAADEELSKAAAEATAKAEAEIAAADKSGESADGILAKDGKNVLPYHVLESTRARNVELERTQQEQADRIKQLEAGTGKPAGDGETSMLSEEDLAAVEEEMPSLGRVLRAQQATLQQFQEGQAAQEQRQREEAAEEQRSIAKQIEDAKAANPKLLEWESNNPVRFNKAAEIDLALRGDPEWKNKPFDERFAEAVTRTQRHYGDPIDEIRKQLSKEELQRRADDALKASGDFIPDTLSNLPGGAAPDVDAAETIHNAHPSDLAGAMEKMSDERIQDVLRGVS